MWLFKRRKRLKTYLVNEKYRVTEAFTHNGVRYFMYENQADAPVGRMLAANAVYLEMEMRCDREYLQAHVKATDKILNENKKGINLTILAQLNQNLKERLDLMPLPDFVYKLASVVFFDETESPLSYDYEYNQKKIENWKKDDQMLDFFLQRLASDLIPSLRSAGRSTKTYFQVAEKIDKIHRQNLTEVLSENI
jgi:hypothetical protein